MTRTMLTKRIIVMTILRRHSSAHRRRSSSNLLQSQAPVTTSPVRRRYIFLVFQNVLMMRMLMMIKFYQLGGSVPNSLGRCSPLSRYFKLQTHHHHCLQSSWWPFFSLQQEKFVHKRFKPSPFSISRASRGFDNFRTSFFCAENFFDVDDLEDYHNLTSGFVCWRADVPEEFLGGGVENPGDLVPQAHCAALMLKI